MKLTEARKKALHSSLRHQLKVSKFFHLSQKDLKRYDGLYSEFQDLCMEFRMLQKQYPLYGIRGYLDPNIREEYGEKASQEMSVLYDRWCDLRIELESFLQEKGLPSEYPERVMARPYIGAEVGTVGYDGSFHSTDTFDQGPARWCAIAFDGSMNEIHNRLYLQRIELITKLGLIVGLIGVVLSTVSLIQS